MPEVANTTLFDSSTSGGYDIIELPVHQLRSVALSTEGEWEKVSDAYGHH